MGKEDMHARVLYLYQILRHDSDAEHPLTTQQIQKLMEERYGITLHRVSVQTYIDILDSCGIRIHQQRAQDKYYYLEDRTFDIPELKLMLDAVQASKFIPPDQTEALTEKLLTLTSDYNAEVLRQDFHPWNQVKAGNADSYAIVRTIHEAIHARRKLSFYYFEYNAAKEKVLRNNGDPYVVSPWTTIWNGDHYYLIGLYEDCSQIRTFRIDRISGTPEILSAGLTPAPADFDVSVYSREMFRMYGTDELTEVCLLCENETMKHLIDHFGIDVDTEPVDADHFRARVQVYPSPTFYRWVFGWCGKIRIASPEPVLAEYRRMAQAALE